MSTDAALVADAAGGTLLTVGAGRTKAQDLTTALDVLANVRVMPLGLVLISGGIGWLLLRLRQTPPSSDDDGAQV